MKKTIIAALMALGIKANAQSSDQLALIPKPNHIEMQVGSFLINKSTRIVAKNAEDKKVAEMLNYFLKKKYNRTLKVQQRVSIDAIVLNIAPPDDRVKDCYELKVRLHRIDITGDKSGVFYGAMSLLQIISEKKGRLSVPAVLIADQPAFLYRGMMLDVGRHFFSVDEIEKLLDVMAYLKMNRFHWHLTDDQGWRLQIKGYPKLTDISAWRDSTIIGKYSDYKPFIYDGQKTGGFYTQEQARHIVRFAAERNIEVVPEIEMPGHSSAVLAAYPELGNGAAKYEVPGYWGVHHTIYNPGDSTFKFLENVLTEVMAIFPSKFIHIGGDEVPKDEWKKSALAEKIISDNHLKDENELQSWFITRIEQFLNRNGRNLIGWDEILEGGLSPNATVMSWRGEKGGIRAAKMKHNVVMTPDGSMYLDYAQAKDSRTEPLTIGGFLPLDVVYNYHPVPAALTVDEQKYILGVQGNMWTEYVPTNQKLEYMIFPRLMAVAEIGWTRSEHKDFENFATQRLPGILKDMEKFGINYCIPEAKVQITNSQQAGRKNIAIIPLVAGSKVYYTIDGHNADNTGTLYSGVFTRPFSAGRSLTLKYVVITADNRMSQEFSVDTN
jgi:hexosaminidase